MNTARDLVIVAMDVAPDRPLERGDLSLALAGAELLDLADAGALAVDGEHIVPATASRTGDRLLDQAADQLVREQPYEAVEEWLWRRGRELASAYADALEKDGVTARSRRTPFRAPQTELVDSPERERARERWVSDEPVLVALAAAAGIREESEEDAEKLTDDVAATVLAAVGDAVMELEAVRQRRAIEDAAFDNVWRGF
ncbi:GPP34 family phosphoprotein [Streptomyces sp. NPDC088387]|uniref:GOLPH3/VPS74 family protein n=1 Tax=Streptomyces sp. NPDC088387 TaxID=3365859 RepID=UPI00380F2756